MGDSDVSVGEKEAIMGDIVSPSAEAEALCLSLRSSANTSCPKVALADCVRTLFSDCIRYDRRGVGLM